MPSDLERRYRLCTTPLSLPRIAARAPRRCARVAEGDSMTLVNVRLLTVRVSLGASLRTCLRLGGEGAFLDAAH